MRNRISLSRTAYVVTATDKFGEDIVLCVDDDGQTRWLIEDEAGSPEVQSAYESLEDAKAAIKVWLCESVDRMEMLFEGMPVEKFDPRWQSHVDSIDIYATLKIHETFMTLNYLIRNSFVTQS